MSILVNDVEITEAEVGQEMQYHPADSQERAWQMAAESLVVRQLLLQQAAGSGLNQEQPEEELIDQLLQQDVIVPEADEATCQRFYGTHPDSFIDEESGKRLAFDQAQAPIRDYLHTKAMRMAVAEYIKALGFNARIKGYVLSSPGM
jgi:hypothetical protein